jgi:hypothetical protein
MARNKYFKDYSGEHDVIEDLTIEIIKTMGRDMIYIPRDIISKDDIFGEDRISKFQNGFELEMFIQSIDGFEGEGDLLSKYGLQIKDKVELLISKKRFQKEITTLTSIDRPREGDLVYFPLSKTLFEINFVEHENPFYQLGKLFVYKLTCETFAYDESMEIETGIDDVDIIDEERKVYEIRLSLGTQVSSSTYTNFIEGETVFQISNISGGTYADADVTGQITNWDADNKLLYVTGLDGTLSTGSSNDSIVGMDSAAEYLLTGTDTTTTIIIQDPEDDESSGDNEDLEWDVDTDNIFDFTETDPFSEGGY